MVTAKIEFWSLVVAVLTVAVSVFVAIGETGRTREAIYEARIQSRVASCTSLAALYATQSWAYDPIRPESYAKYGVPANTRYDPDGPNQRLAEYSHKAIATSRAIQLCLVENDGRGEVSKCLAEDVDSKDAHKVDDSSPPDLVVDNLIC
jgi:hypothetical protein